MWAIANTKPLSSKLNLTDEKEGSMVEPYDPYPYWRIGVFLLSSVSTCLTIDIGIFLPSCAVANNLSEV